ncbi:hypothetical protein CANMA_001866 [Candida margitis]|uniref:uncharacterized protein n=1 Tax=Candida margitis TaxID=1775924 RepID=UPI002226E8DC|nr:uncharacterized protein CANMA_001866 [Candida margitis]KAI5969095.1 hypothetical protein CANMA_001866 [Candida margitis]
MVFSQVKGLGIGLPMYPGCNELELIYNCLIAIPYGLKVEYFRSTELKKRTIHNGTGNFKYLQKHDGFDECYQSKAANSNTVEPVLPSLEKRTLHALKGSPKLASEEIAITTKMNTSSFHIRDVTHPTQHWEVFGQENLIYASVNNIYSVFPQSQDVKRSKWDVLYDEKIQPLLPPYWQGQAPSDCEPTFVYMPKKIAHAARLNKKNKSLAEEEIKFYDEMVHFHLLYKEVDERLETRNKLELKLYIRIMSLYYIAMGLITFSTEDDLANASEEEPSAEKLLACGKIINGVFTFLIKVLKQWEKLPISKIRFVGQVNQTLESMIPDVEKENEMVIKAIEDADNTKRGLDLDEEPADNYFVEEYAFGKETICSCKNGNGAINVEDILATYEKNKTHTNCKNDQRSKAKRRKT